ncbi:Small nuclear ribonucleoprotein SmD3b, partial [Cucurbita argyrosperma subsp. sororia]
MSRSLGIPVKLLHEAAGHVVSVELKSGELYRGSMIECEDNWNCQLENITYTAKDGKVSQLEHVFIRGSKVRFMVIPDMLKNAPMFKRLDARIKGKGASLGVGRGRAVAMRAKAQAAGRGGATGRGAVPSARRRFYVEIEQSFTPMFIFVMYVPDVLCTYITIGELSLCHLFYSNRWLLLR